MPRILLAVDLARLIRAQLNLDRIPTPTNRRARPSIARGSFFCGVITNDGVRSS